MTTTAFLAADTGTGVPPADVDFSLELLAGLLADQHPDLADQRLELVASGWDNWMVAIGPDLCARMPRRAVADQLIASEQAHLPRLAPHLPVPVPVPVRVGVPGRGYPYRWSVLGWLPGQTVARAPLAASQGPALAGFLKALHSQPANGLPDNPARNGGLDRFDGDVRTRLSRLVPVHPWLAALAEAVWTPALSVQGAETPVFLHGDLHARNVLCVDGILSAVIDWGDMTFDDPMFDLGAVWHLLDDAGARAQALAGYGADTALITRARAWAMRIGLLLLDTGGPDMPEHATMGLATLERLAEDAGL
ncbi:MAG: phosphotransferase, partial [Hyphomonadaceae bacterium]|nr:phosphotransferase [Hyphomonadaceae bacterium]